MRWLLITLLFLPLACSRPALAQEIEVLGLFYMESEPGIEPYPVRMLITPDHLRMDEGEGSASYLLYERKHSRVLSVSHTEASVLVFSASDDRPDMAAQPELAHSLQDTLDMPTFGGKQPVSVRLNADKQLCMDLIAIPKLRPDAVAAMAGYLKVMASQHLKNLEKTPVAMRSPCMLADLIYAPAQYLEFGLPLRTADYRGVVRELQDIRVVPVESELLTVDPLLSILPMD